ncbi:MAG: hypothetical protein ABFS08_10985 [Pseudomonadota bacterium]
MTTQNTPFLSAYKGYLSNILKWEELDMLWQTLRAQANAGWHLYAVGETVPQQPATAEQVTSFIEEIDKLLHSEHQEDYCGIVYVDDRESPTLIKIYDPNHLGSSCGPGWGEVLPGWVLSTLPPVDLKATIPPPNNRRRWWQNIFS